MTDCLSLKRSLFIQAVSILPLISSLIVGCDQSGKIPSITSSESNSNSGDHSGKNDVGKTVEKRGELEWEEETLSSKTLKVKRRVLNPKIVQERLSTIARTPVFRRSTSFGEITLLGSSDSAGVSDGYFRPKLIVMSDVFGGRVQFNDLRNGDEEARFSIAFLDGLKDSIHTGFSVLSIGDWVRVPDEEHLSAELGQKVRFITLEDCPEKLYLQSGSERLDLKFSAFNGICQRNHALEVTAVGLRSKIHKWFEEKLAGGGVSLVAEFRPKTGFTREVISLDLNLFELMPKIRSVFSTTAEVGALRLSDAHDRIQGVIQKEVSSLNAGSEGLLVSTEMDELIDAVFSSFTEPTQDHCPEVEDHRACVALKEGVLPTEDNLHFEFRRQSVVPVEADTYFVSAQIQDLAVDTRLFTIEGEGGDDSTPPTSGPIGGLLRQVADGDLLEIELSEIIGLKRQRRILDQYSPLDSKPENPVCISYGPVPMKEELDSQNCIRHACAETRTIPTRSEERCFEYVRTCYVGNPMGDSGAHYFDCTQKSQDENCCQRATGGGAARCSDTRMVPVEFRTECVREDPNRCLEFGKHWVPAGPAPCIQTENQWMKHYDFSDVISINPIRQEFSSIESGPLLSGLKLQFSNYRWSAEKGKYRADRMTCPLSAFEPRLTQMANKLLIQVRASNRPDGICVPFNEENSRPGYYPEISLVNQYTTPEEIPCGYREDFWNGRSVYTCPKINQSGSDPIQEIYYPRYTIIGKLRLPGKRFVSISDLEEGKL